MPTCRLLLTGVNGFIGNNVLAHLMALDPAVLHPSFKGATIEVLGTDLPESMDRATARRFAGSARFRYVDAFSAIEDMNNRQWIPHAVIHNGACSSTTEQNWEVFQKLNLNSSMSLWEFCAQHQIPFLYASSAAVYGSGEQGFDDDPSLCSNYTPLNLYGKSKLDFDLWVLQQKKAPSAWFGLRYFNVFGPFESHKGGQASMVFHGYNQVLKNGCIRLFESNDPAYQPGEQQRDFVYVGDVVDVTIALLQKAFHKQPGSGFINIGQGVANTWNNLAKNIFTALGLAPKITYIPMPASLMKQYQNYTCASLGGLKRMGIEHSFKTLEEGVLRYVQKHLTRGE